MEFLGDAVLGFVSAEYLYKELEGEREGALTSFRSRITSGEALAGIAENLSLGDFILLGCGEDASGGRQRPSNLADSLEAIMGAACLDGGVDAVRKIFERIFVSRFRSLGRDAWEGNPKGKLQEYSQHMWKNAPTYVLERRRGPDHDSVFTVKVELKNGTVGRGEGRSKQDAEREAALDALERIRLSEGE